MRRVHAESVHAAAVADGSLLASTRDDTSALRAWLEQQSALGDTDSVEAELSGVWPAVRIGDRVRDPRGPGFVGRPPVVRSVTIDFTVDAGRRAPRTTLVMRG